MPTQQCCAARRRMLSSTVQLEEANFEGCSLRSRTLQLHVDKVRFAVEALMDLKALQVCLSLHTSTAYFLGLSHNE
jgi:hypothetical protein